MFTKEDYDLIAPVVDGFSLMTYDYPNHGRYFKVYYSRLYNNFQVIKMIQTDLGVIFSCINLDLFKYYFSYFSIYYSPLTPFSHSIFTLNFFS